MNVLKLKATRNVSILSSSIVFSPNIQNKSVRHASSIFKDEDVSNKLKSFNATFPIMKKHLLKKFQVEPVAKHFEALLDYQVPFGRQSRAIMVLNAYECINPRASENTENGMSKIQVMAWIVEMFQAYAVFVDDIIDNSKSRRGKLPWHIGRERFITFDLSMLLTSVSLLLNDFFENAPFYTAASRLIQEGNVLKVCEVEAQDLFFIDLIRSKNVCMNGYKTYASSKALYSTEFPFKLAAYLATNSAVDLDKFMIDALTDIGYLMQLMNDSLGIFEDAVSGKLKDEDIKEGKFTWFLAFVFENATEQDKQLIAENYGKLDENSIQSIMKVFKKFDLKINYLQYEEQLIDSIEKKLERVPNDKGFRDAIGFIFKIILDYRMINPSIIKISN